VKTSVSQNLPSFVIAAKTAAAGWKKPGWRAANPDG